MIRHLQMLLKDAVLYGVASGLARFVKVLLVPIVARTVPAAEFGAFDSVNVYTFVAALMAVVGLDSSVVLLARRPGAGPAEARAAAGTAFTTVALLGLALAVAGILGAGAWSTLLLGTPAFRWLVVWAAISIPFSAVLIFTLALLKWEFRRRWFLLASLGSAVFSIGLTYVAAFHSSLGLAGLMAATTAGQAFGAAVGVWAARDLLWIHWDRQMGQRLLALGAPFAAMGIASAAAPSIDRLFLSHAHSLADTGVYAVGQRIAMLQALVLGGFQAAWGPFAVSMARTSEKPALFAKVFLLVSAAGAYGTILLVVAAPVLIRIFAGGEYAAATEFVLPLGLSVALGAVFFVVSIGAFLEERTIFNLYAYAVGLGATLLMNVLLLVLRTPPIGIAWANCLGQLTAVSFIAHLSQRVHPIPYPFLKGFGLFLACAAAGTWLAVRGRHPAFALATGIAVTMIFSAWVWLNVLTARGRETVLARRAAADE